MVLEAKRFILLLLLSSSAVLFLWRVVPRSQELDRNGIGGTAKQLVVKEESGQEKAIVTDMRVLFDEATQCTRIPHRKPRLPLTDAQIRNATWNGRSHIVIESRKALYCSIGRIGCSRWRSLAMVLNGIPLSEGYSNKKVKSLRYLELSEVRRIVTDDCYFRFVFVRDPFSRLLSAWHHMR